MKIKDRIKAFKRVPAKDLLPQKEEMDMSGLPPLWRPVVGYEGIYEVSRLGQVRRVKCGRGAGVWRRVKRQSKHKRGYLVVTLYQGNQAKGFLVHRLVAEAFHGPIGDNEINHKDGNKKNNRFDNLEIVTRQQNINHAVAAGLIANKGEGNSQAKLSKSQVQEIRSLYTPGGYRNGGLGYKALGKRYGISWGTVRGIIKRKIWQHVA